MRFLIFFFVAFSCFSAETQIELGGQILTVEIADKREEQEKGLMGRSSLPEGSGMLFVYPKPVHEFFWMKNTLIPLSIGFFDAENRLISTADMDPPSKKSPLRLYGSKAPYSYALEVPQGWFDKNKIRPGMKFSFHDPSIPVK